MLGYFMAQNKRMYLRYRIPVKSRTRPTKDVFRCVYCHLTFDTGGELRDHLVPTHYKEILSKVQCNIYDFVIYVECQKILSLSINGV